MTDLKRAAEECAKIEQYWLDRVSSDPIEEAALNAARASGAGQCAYAVEHLICIDVSSEVWYADTTPHERERLFTPERLRIGSVAPSKDI